MAKKFAYDRLFGSDVKEEIAKKLEEGGHKYRWLYRSDSSHPIYAVDPSGWIF